MLCFTASQSYVICDTDANRKEANIAFQVLFWNMLCALTTMMTAAALAVLMWRSKLQ